MVQFFFYVIMCNHNLDRISSLKIERFMLLLPLYVINLENNQQIFMKIVKTNVKISVIEKIDKIIDVILLLLKK